VVLLSWRTIFYHFKIFSESWRYQYCHRHDTGGGGRISGDNCPKRWDKISRWPHVVSEKRLEAKVVLSRWNAELAYDLHQRTGQPDYVVKYAVLQTSNYESMAACRARQPTATASYCPQSCIGKRMATLCRWLIAGTLWAQWIVFDRLVSSLEWYRSSGLVEKA